MKRSQLSCANNTQESLVWLHTPTSLYYDERSYTRPLDWGPSKRSERWETQGKQYLQHSFGDARTDYGEWGKNVLGSMRVMLIAAFLTLPTNSIFLDLHSTPNFDRWHWGCGYTLSSFTVDPFHTSRAWQGTRCACPLPSRCQYVIPLFFKLILKAQSLKSR